MSTAKLIVASVRLPVSVIRSDPSSQSKGWSVTASPGGSTSALRAVAAHRPLTWIGWPGSAVPEGEREQVTRQLATHQAIPLFIEGAEFEGFYHQFSNRVLWPRFHNLSGPSRLSAGDAWQSYFAVNQRFADAIAERAAPGDTVWIHDYQLTLVPQMLRERGLECPIGFYLHSAFPSSMAFRALPVREQILRGMLGADLIGFQTYEYVSHFRSACLRILGLDSDPESMVLPTHNANFGVMPAGVDPHYFQGLAASAEGEARYRSLRKEYAGVQVVLGVDRFDYTKGLPHKLWAYEELLRRHPELHGRVVLIQVAAPSRMGVAEYQALKREVDELAGRINSTYCTLDWTPLVYINQNLSQTELTALYRLADVALVTPVCDGLNLVALEYVASRSEPGTLMLSEFAGAAACLSGAILVNPHDSTQLAEQLAAALAEPPSEQDFEHMRELVHGNTSEAWGRGFLSRLEQCWTQLHESVSQLRVDRGAAGELARRARAPLFLLDYEGTLRSEDASDAEPSPRIRTLLVELSEVATVYLLSDHPAEVLGHWFGDLPVGLVCEHGLAIREPEAEWVEVDGIDTEALTEIVMPVFEDFRLRTPGSTVVRRRASLSWHYRGADPKFGVYRSKELHSLLDSRLAGQPFTVISQTRAIEVRHVQTSKASAAQRLIARHPEADLIVAAGDDRTDEEMFEAVTRAGAARALVCRVGGVNTVAPYVVRSPDELIEQLEALVDGWREPVSFSAPG